MGSSRWSDDDYSARKSYRAATNTPAFKHDDSVRKGKAFGVHSSLNPKGVSIRESRDSDAHPNSRAVAVMLDVTGSMGMVPRAMQENLPKLMGLLLRKAYLPDPHILIAAVGDANSDKVPLQVGQFEAGIEIDNDITNLFLEGGGGGQNMETYELGMYFLARKAKMDCLEKRGEKGYLFIIGDEKPYSAVFRGQVEAIIGDTLEADISTKDIVEELKEKFEVFFIIPNLSSHFNAPWLFETWNTLFPERVLKLEDPAAICELIAATIAMCEGFDHSSVTTDLKDAGTDLSIVNAVGKEVSKISGSGKGLAVKTSGAGSGLV